MKFFALARMFLQFNRFWELSLFENSGKLLANQQINAFWNHTHKNFCSCKDIPAIQHEFGSIHVRIFCQVFANQQINAFWTHTYQIFCKDIPAIQQEFVTIHVRIFWQVFTNQQINAFWTHTYEIFCSCKDIPAIQQVLGTILV